jgi:hypothetical protein
LATSHFSYSSKQSLGSSGFLIYNTSRILSKENSFVKYTSQDLDKGESQSFQSSDTRLSYRKDRDAKWEYEIRTTNLLDINLRIRNNANNISVFSSETFIQPRFVTFVYTL